MKKMVLIILTLISFNLYAQNKANLDLLKSSLTINCTMKHLMNSVMLSLKIPTRKLLMKQTSLSRRPILAKTV
jgi:hypothetical protein